MTRTADERREIERQLLLDLIEFESLSDRVCRVNAPTLVARGERLWTDDGYRNQQLMNGMNVVVAVLKDFARDRGLDA